MSVTAAGIRKAEFTLIAGPCAVESREQTLTTAECVAAAGATMLRGGAFKPRTSPRSFQASAAPAWCCCARPARGPGSP
jgi:3-deoxy-7-phosphoheptulonate synthase